ncbi:hypothetical protein [Virgibacillus sp. YIM 98842]|uniref:hypothetical protein n=1 Tax=Virgibacillus sp. YIM 98842 TaxID=2663533 RepID=UPI0013DA7BC9|nr:hypothetical protein [Virgibacillus sp. YIM 98842]
MKERMTDEEKKELMEEELEKLKNESYISYDTYNKMLHGYQRYYEHSHQTTESVNEEQKEDKEPKQKQLSDWQIQYTKEAEHEKERSADKQNASPSKKAKRLSAQEIRERNITWSLAIGVILLLIGGTVLATSTWDMLSHWMKTGMIALVAILFFGLAVFTNRILHISKTAFAFHVLGSLFLPIVYISIGFYEQLGPYLSISGEGRFLYGAIGCLILLPVYLFLAAKLQARLFVWFSNVTLSLLAGFLIAWFNLPVDGFYLGIMLFNSLLIAGYYFLRKSNKWKLFTNEFVLYMQGNLILSTMLMLVFYNSDVFHGFNLILTAVIYFAMIYATNHREYHFVFSAMLVYGAFQVIEFSALHNIGPVAYALLGFVFLALPKFIEDKHGLARVFRYTSAVISGLAFIYITLQGMVVRMEDPSIILVIAYLLIAGNFIYLANLSKEKNVFFSYLSSIFLMTALFETIRIGETFLPYESLTLPMFFAGFAFYIVFGGIPTAAILKIIKTSSRDIAMAVMGLCLFLRLGLLDFEQAGIMLLFISLFSFVMKRFETRDFVKKGDFVTWLQPLSLGMAIVFIYAAYQSAPLGDFGPFEPLPLVYASIALLIATGVWHYAKKEKYKNHTFYASQGFYYTGMLLTMHISYFDFDPILRAVIVFGGIIMAYLLYRKIKSPGLSYVVSSISLLFYLTALFALHVEELMMTSSLVSSLQLPFGAFLLFAAGLILRKYDRKLTNAFWWAGHIYYPFALIISLFYGEIAVWSAALAVIVYGLSVLFAEKEWKIKVFLYAGFTSVWILILYLMMNLNLEDHYHYAWLATSIILTAGWFFSSQVWKNRMIYYILPFSFIGAYQFTFSTPFELTALIVAILYAGLIIGLLHVKKWDILNILPLFLVFTAFLKITDYYPEADYLLFLIFAVIFISAGRFMYTDVYKENKNSLPRLDWYTITGFAGIGLMYIHSEWILWEQILPGILAAFAIFLQKDRLSFIKGKWVTAIAIAYLLEPYYSLLGFIELPELLVREFYVLPWIALAIFIKRVAGKKHQRNMNYMQWAVLVIAALLLVQDGLASNTVYDAIIVGTLSLGSMVGGMYSKQKSFFFVGAGVLLLNLFLQTRPFWGAMPWWAYLLIAGSILITLASYNEWHKQKTTKGKETLITKFNKKVVQKIKKWD